MFHNRYCASERWKSLMADEVLPWVLADVAMRGPVLEVGPGPGIVTEALLRYGVEDLTTEEEDLVNLYRQSVPSHRRSTIAGLRAGLSYRGHARER